MAELEDLVHKEILLLSEEGDRLAEAGSYADAIKLYGKAWGLLPEPKVEWDAAQWLLAAIGDASFLSGQWQNAQEALQYCLLHCPGAIGNPFLHFRLGQSYFELTELDRAADELMRAYIGAGEEIFEQHDPKYRNFLATRAILDERW